MPLSERVLMGPGPCNPYPEATAAFARPMLGHLDPEFIELLDETNERLRTVFGTTNALTFPVSGTGSAGMEAAFVNLLGAGDTVVIGVNGVFGMRMCDLAARCGAEVVRVDADWGQPVDTTRMLEAHPNPSMYAVVHAETSTGVRTDVEDLGANKGDALLLIDCVTSLGGLPMDLDAWGVDAAYSGTQKCLGVAPGLSPLTLSNTARERIKPVPQSWYLDLNMIAAYVGSDGGTRAYHHTAPISMIFSLHAGLGAVLDEGIDQVIARHAACGEALQTGVQKLGLELFAAEEHRLPQLTSVWVPEERLPTSTTEAEVRSLLLSRYGIEIGGGLGPVAGKVWRIGCMGNTARLRNVELLLGALGEILD
ncbi:MAG: alanine--glyoxylate aminotransferase family protein [Acidimicrobiales bacterium]|nr:alanine--glyoxylate aminotransferase family protein [Acidimicrobiales bacterium]MDG2219116.1 alanine--glyoxylate aminotransferase family protein [Acidimicrobiales bacterium]